MKDPLEEFAKSEASTIFLFIVFATVFAFVIVGKYQFVKKQITEQENKYVRIFENQNLLTLKQSDSLNNELIDNIYVREYINITFLYDNSLLYYNQNYLLWMCEKDKDPTFIAFKGDGKEISYVKIIILIVSLWLALLYLFHKRVDSFFSKRDMIKNIIICILFIVVIKLLEQDYLFFGAIIGIVSFIVFVVYRILSKKECSTRIEKTVFFLGNVLVFSLYVPIIVLILGYSLLSLVPAPFLELQYLNYIKLPSVSIVHIYGMFWVSVFILKFILIKKINRKNGTIK